MEKKSISPLFIIVAFLVSIGMAAFISPWASSLPDGLEKVAEQMGFLHKAQGEAMWTHSPMPEYALPGVQNESLSTGLAGLLGTLAVFCLTSALAWGLIKRRHRQSKP